MTLRRFCNSVLPLSLLLGACGASAATATTFVRVADRLLARQANVIAEVTVTSGDASPVPDRPATDYVIHVDRVLQGSVPGSSLVVRVPGGAAGAGGLVVWGSPTFHEGERALLFLVPSQDGSYRLSDLLLGAFHEVSWKGRRLAARDLSQAAELVAVPGGEPRLQEAAEAPRDWELFTSWLAARAGGGGGAGQAAREQAAYQVDLSPADLARVEALATPGRPDEVLRAPAAAEISWFANPGALGGQPGSAPAGSDDLGKSYSGTTSSVAGLDRFDGRSAVLFSNPGANPDLPAYDCGTGGLVSLSGTWFDSDRRVQGGSVLLAAGLSCLGAGAAGTSAPGVQEVLAHDLPQALLGTRPSGVGRAAARTLTPSGASRASTSASLPSAPAAVTKAAAAPAPVTKAAAAPVALQPAAIASASSGQLGRGYHSRACGFDLNHNGIFGEPADCHVCDGITTNPYNDSTPPNLVYVSCQTGADNPSCGSPGNPCGSINYAWNYRTGPPSSQSADIICFRGTCHEDGISTNASGKGGSYTLAATGSEAINWQLPTHPTMLAGWDYNHNGQYPPYDTRDEAVLEGSGFAQALKLNGNQINSDVELAHFTVRSYGTGVNVNPTGFMQVSNGAYGTSNHVYIHDISIQDVNRGKGLDSGNIMFDFFGSNAQISYFAVDNVEILNAGGYIARGAAPSGGLENGPYRFKNITWTALGCNASGAGACADPQSQAHVIGWKLWGYVSQIEILDSILNLNTSAWAPYQSGFGSTAFFPAQCSRNWTIRNNEIDDFKTGLIVQGYAAGYCDGAAARPVDGVTFDRNTFRNTYTHWLWNDNGVQILGGGPSPQSSIGTVLVSNNFFSSTPGWQGMAYISGGNSGGPDPANLIFANNTTVANQYRAGFGQITVQKNYAFVPQSITVKNNIFGGMASGQENIHTDYAPASWSAGSNVFDPNGIFSWNGNQLGSLAAWQQATGNDLTARQCLPAFANAGGGDFHLVLSDTCAAGLGVLMTNWFTWDIDGWQRPVVAPWTAGAHQLHPTAPASGPLNFYTVTPCRVLDTRTAGVPLTTSTPSVFPVAGMCGIPSNAVSVAFNVTAVGASALVDVQVYPGDKPAPGTNVVSVNTSRPTRAVAAVIALASNAAGTVGVLPSFQTPGRVDLVLDVSGYFAP